LFRGIFEMEFKRRAEGIPIPFVLKHILPSSSYNQIIAA
jgi:hypothetical protein